MKRKRGMITKKFEKTVCSVSYAQEIEGKLIISDIKLVFHENLNEEQFVKRASKYLGTKCIIKEGAVLEHETEYYRMSIEDFLENAELLSDETEIKED